MFSVTMAIASYIPSPLTHQEATCEVTDLQGCVSILHDVHTTMILLNKATLTMHPIARWHMTVYEYAYTVHMEKKTQIVSVGIVLRANLH
jgi:hypothetical protein